MSRGAKLLLVALVCGAVTANCLRLPLYFKLDLLFGSIFTMLVIQLFGFRWGIITAVLSSASAWFAFGHLSSGINAVCEAAFVGYLLQKRERGFVYLSATYWILLGMPLAWLYFTLRLPAGDDLPWLIMLKQGINGISNALVAQLLVNLFLLSPGLSHITHRRHTSFQQLISTILAACVLFPLLTLTILSIREEFEDEMAVQAIRELDRVVAHSQGTVQAWLNERLADFNSLAQLQSSFANVAGKRINIHQINELDRNIVQIGFIDRRGISIAFDPPVDMVTGRANVGLRFADTAKLKALHAAAKPVLSPVTRGLDQHPQVVVNVPVLTAGKFQGFVTGVVDLQGVSGLLSQLARDWSCRAILLDSQRRIIAASDASWPLLEKFDRHGGRIAQLNDATYRWSPDSMEASGQPERWRHSYYVREIQLSPDISWRLILEVPQGQRLHALNQLFIKDLFFMIVVTMLTLVGSHLIGKRLALSLERLRNATTGLPDTVSSQKKIDWPVSHIAEIDSLITNFRNVAASLSEKFGELSAGNRELCRENQERRKAEEKLGQAVSELMAIFQAFPDLCLVVDRETTVLDCRGRMHDMIPPAGGIAGKRLTETFSRDVAARYGGKVEQALDSGAMVTFEYCLPGDTGDNHFETRIVPLARDQVVIIIRNITDLKKAEELRLANEQLRHLSMYIEDARENERACIAREIHDELGQQLTALRFDLGWISKRLDGTQVHVASRIAEMARLLDGTIKSVRRIATELRPRLLDDLGLVAALEWQVSEFTKRTGIPCELQLERNDMVVERRRATALYRILQEALTNIIRHAQASRVTIAFREEGGMLLLQVMDNGKGISAGQMKGESSFGMLGMQERAREWGGTMMVSGEPGRGTSISVAIPLEDKEL
ncbi:ATP-binding protein [Geotalea sp. SG265]|uniref:sensor histidine kinase n=1 Tax=Geotalea sp. SG265 TaxID=2922867 RepID=UPI001FAFD41E|nr:ATP-binding protein [Geotalea sp. SG265]